MKKTIKTILCMAAFAVLAISCQKENNGVEPVADVKGTIEININGLMGEYTQVDATKSSLVNTVRVSWENGDIVYVYDGTQCLGSLVASIDGTEDRYAILSTDKNHTVTAPTAGTKLTLVHSPLLTEAPAVSDGAISISLANQNGTKAPFVAYATLDYNDEESINNAIVPFKFATSVIKVNCTGLNANTAIDIATLSNVNTACTLAFSGTGAPAVAGDVKGVITRTGDTYFAASKVNDEGVAVFQIAVPVLEKASESRVMTISQGPANFKYMKFSKKSLEAATSVNTVCQFLNLPDGAIPGKFSVADSKQVFFSQGNLWADTIDPENPVFNLETHQYDFKSIWSQSHVSHFFWSKFVEDAIKGDEEWEHDGSADDVFFTNVVAGIANPDFTVNGVTGKYRTLSFNEWKYLLDNRTVNGGTGNDKSYSLNITYGGNMGLVLYPDNYNGSALTPGTEYTDENFPEDCVFLPGAGLRIGIDILFPLGGGGIYWTSSGKEYDENDIYNEAFGVSIGKDQVGLAIGKCVIGSSVRLVTDCK